MNKLFMTIAAAIMATGTAVHAATFSIDGGTPGTIPSAGQTNEVLDALGIPSPLGGFFQSSISISEAAQIRVDVMGHEAGFVNTFTFGTDSFSTTGTSDGPGNAIVASDLDTPLASWVVAPTNILDFVFSTTNTNAFNSPLTNGDANSNGNRETNFFAAFGPGGLWLFYDDGGGTNDDDNHDDLVIRLSAVPLPPAVLAFLSALGGLAFAARRRKAQV